MLQSIAKKQKPRKYEVMFLLDNREVKKGWEQAKGIPLAVLERFGAKIISARQWDERKLAYEIKKQRRASYLLVYFEVLSDQLVTINREVALTEGILRHLVIALDEFPELAFEPVDDKVDVSQIKTGNEVEEALKSNSEDQSKPAEDQKKEEESPKEEGDEKSDAEQPEQPAEVIEDNGETPEEKQEGE